MKLNRKFLFTASAVLVAALIIRGALDALEFIEIDRCLDAGGSWYFNKGKCFYTESYSP